MESTISNLDLKRPNFYRQIADESSFIISWGIHEFATITKRNIDELLIIKEYMDAQIIHLSQPKIINNQITT